MYALLLDLPLERKGEGFLSGAFLVEIGKMALASVVMAAAAWGVLHLTGGLVAGKLGLLISMGAAAGVGAVVYFAAAMVLGLREALMVRDMAQQVLKRG